MIEKAARRRRDEDARGEAPSDLDQVVTVHQLFAELVPEHLGDPV